MLRVVCGGCTVLLLHNSSSQLATQMQPVVGLSTSSFSLVFELYVQSDDQEAAACWPGAQLTLVACNGKPGHHEVVLHLGVNGTERSEMRQDAPCERTDRHTSLLIPTNIEQCFEIILC